MSVSSALDVKSLFEQDGAVHRDHFVLSQKPDSSWPHVIEYLNAEGLSDQSMDTLCFHLANRVLLTGFPAGVEMIVGPANGALRVVDALCRFMHIIPVGIIASKDNIGGYKLDKGDERYVRSKRPRTLIVDDVVVRGTALGKVARLIGKNDGSIVGAACIASYTGAEIATDLGLEQKRFIHLWQPNIVTMTEDECASTGPCSKGIRVRTDLGHGVKWLALRSRLK